MSRPYPADSAQAGGTTIEVGEAEAAEGLGDPLGVADDDQAQVVGSTSDGTPRWPTPG